MNRPIPVLRHWWTLTYSSSLLIDVDLLIKQNDFVDDRKDHCFSVTIMTLDYYCETAKPPTLASLDTNPEELVCNQ